MAAPKVIRQNTTGRYTVTLKDEDDAAIASASINSITMTYYDQKTKRIINSRSAQNVKDANNCTIHATSGLFTWSIQQGDTVILNEKNADEVHVALITVTYSSTKVGSHEVLLKVLNVTKVGDV